MATALCCNDVMDAEQLEELRKLRRKKAAADPGLEEAQGAEVGEAVA